MNFFTGLYLVLFFFGIFFLLIFIFLQWQNAFRLHKNPKMTKAYSVSFLVPAYNEEKSIENTVIALLNLNYPKDKREIIIINDGSTDRTLEIAKRLASQHFGIRVLDKNNSGKANSLNEALAIAKGELVAVVDADSYPQPASLSRMVGFFDDIQVAAVTSRVLVKNKPNWLCNFQVLDYSIIAWTRKLLDFVDSVYVTNGPLSVYRKSYARKVGGFDPRNLTEDIEITWHLLSKGYKTRMAYDAIVYTTVPESLKIWIKQRVRWNLGGIQTVQKYWKSMFKQGAFGYFVVPYVSASFAFAIIGFILLLRYFWIKGIYHAISAYYLVQGYGYFNYFDFRPLFTVLLLFGLGFFIMAVYYYKTGFKNSEAGNQSIFNIIIYSFIYRSLYIVPLIMALYKLAKRDVRWYTK